MSVFVMHYRKSGRFLAANQYMNTETYHDHAFRLVTFILYLADLLLSLLRANKRQFNDYCTVLVYNFLPYFSTAICVCTPSLYSQLNCCLVTVSSIFTEQPVYVGGAYRP
jgi:hypothetical protein